MSINRMFMFKKAESSGETLENVFIVTMGQAGAQYGYSRYNSTYGELEGNMKHDGKAVTLVMLSYYGGWLDFAFNLEDVTSGKYNVTVKVTSVETNTSVTIQFPNIQYQSYVPGFYEYTRDLPSEVANMFVAANVGKQFKVEIVFN